MITGLIKQMIILVNMAVLLLFNTFIYQDIAVKVIAPSSTIAGSTVEVEVQINKGSLKGFARYQVEFPNGVIATPVERAFSDFSFQDNTMKLIWLNLPPEEVITIRYALKINERLKGDLDLAGTFSFIENNQRKQSADPTNLLAIQPSPAIDERLIVDVRDAGQKLAAPLPHLTSGQVVAAVRQTPYPGTDNHLIVNLVINKEQIDKYAKIEEVVPVGFRAENLESKGGIFSFRNQEVKYIWMNLPPEPLFTVSYKLIPVDPGTTAKPEIAGVFSYLENDMTKSVNVIQGDINVQTVTRNELLAIAATAPADVPVVTPPVAQVTRPVETRPETQPTTQQVAERPRTQVTTARPVDRSQVDARTQLMNQLEPESGVYYRVQLAAGHKPVNVNRYFRRLNIQDEVRTEIHEGWIKYSIGSYYDYKAARDYRVHIWNTTPVKDAFVAAYNNGARITVQEALMIANHKWYR